MIFYIILLFASFIILLDKTKMKLNSSLFAILFASSLLGLRGSRVGVDTESYYYIYYLINNVPSHPYVEKLEPMYVFLNQFFGFFYHDPVWMIYFVSFFVISVVVFFCSYQSPSFFLSWIGFLSYGHFFAFHNVMRQSIAISVALISILYILRKNILKFLISVFLAAMFHYTAFLFVLAYVFQRIRISFIVFFIFWIISIPFIVYKNLFYELLAVFNWILPHRYLHFLDNNMVLANQGIGLRMLFLQFLFFFMLLAYKEIMECLAYEKEIFFIKIALISLIGTNFLYHAPLLRRGLDYYSILVPISIPYAVNILCKGRSRIMMYVIFTAWYVFTYFRYLFTDPHKILPYSTFFSG